MVFQPFFYIYIHCLHTLYKYIYIYRMAFLARSAVTLASLMRRPAAARRLIFIGKVYAVSLKVLRAAAGTLRVLCFVKFIVDNALLISLRLFFLHGFFFSVEV